MPRRVALALILCVAPMAATRAAEPGTAPDQQRYIGTIDFFGLRQVSEGKVRAQLSIKEGDALQKREDRPDGAAIARALGVAEVTLAYVCCTADQKIMVYVGVVERPARTVRTPPSYTGAARLPDEMIRVDDEYDAQVTEAVNRGQANEDDSQGHALSAYPPLRAVQERVLAFARGHFELLSEVLTTSADPRHRAVAATILGYAPDKRAAAKVLARGAFDSDGGVRNNATRALGVIANYAALHPELGIDIDPEPFVAMLDSAVWTDLNKGLMVLMYLTARRDPATLALLRDRARPTLVDACRWKNAGHSTPACLILRRVEGLPDFGPDFREEVLRKVGADGT
jgi:hypothetical protein